MIRLLLAYQISQKTTLQISTGNQANPSNLYCFLINQRIQSQMNNGVFIIIQNMEPASQSQTKCPYCRISLPSTYLAIHRNRCIAKPSIPARPVDPPKEEQMRKKPSQEVIADKRKKEQRTWQRQRFQCYLCGHMQTIVQLDEHFKICPNRETPCPSCQASFPRNLLVEHMRVCQGPEDDSELQGDSDIFGSSSIDSSRLFSDSQGDQFEDSYDFADDQSDEVDEPAPSSSSTARRPGTIQERRDNILRRVNQMCTERSGRRQFYERLIMELHELHTEIRRRALQQNISRTGGMTKKQISLIPNKKYKFDCNNKQTCSICYTDFAHNEEVKNILCGHLFHVECISQWLLRNKQCPNCKRVVEPAKASKKDKEVKGQPQKFEGKKKEERRQQRRC